MRFVLVIALAACSTSYVPRARGHVALTMQNGQYVYTRDGQSFPQGVFGGGLADAVRGNPAALEAAETYHSRMMVGFITMMLGLAADVGGTLYTVNGAGNNSQNERIGVATLFGGLALMLAGAGVMGSGEPYRWDAINIYNDGP
jgi:hypothetical protein